MPMQRSNPVSYTHLDVYKRQTEEEAADYIPDMQEDDFPEEE